MDHSATTPVDPLVAEAMFRNLTENWGNPSSIHGVGRTAREAVEKARDQVAGLIGAHPLELVFTSGGTEADNLAIIGGALANQKKGRHIITSVIEHHAVLDTYKYLAKQGFEVTYLTVNDLGQVEVETVRQALRSDTILISLMHANNEIGTIQPITEIGALARERGIIFHTDAVQSAGRIAIDVETMNIDLLSLSGHKFYGPKGVGALYMRSGVKITPLVHGGGQERKWRSGTENVPGIIGLGKAAELAMERMKDTAQGLEVLGQTLCRRITAEIPDSRITGHPTLRLPGHVSAVFEGVEGESMLMLLNSQGVAVSSGSSCTSRALKASHVLLAMGLTHEIAQGSILFTIGLENGPEDIDYVLEVELLRREG
jgi:cysteine desulfurase